MLSANHLHQVQMYHSNSSYPLSNLFCGTRTY